MAGRKPAPSESERSLSGGSCVGCHARFQRVPCGLSSSRMPRVSEILADAIGFGEIAAAARVLARLDQLLDLVDRHRRPLVFRPAQRQHAEHAIEVIERAR